MKIIYSQVSGERQNQMNEIFNFEILMKNECDFTLHDSKTFIHTNFQNTTRVPKKNVEAIQKLFIRSKFAEAYQYWPISSTRYTRYALLKFWRTTRPVPAASLC